MKDSHEAIVECVPNISEGRDLDKIRRVVSVLEGVEGVRLLHVDSNPDANRTVVTFVSSPERVIETAINFIRTAIDEIDMRKHKGVHPRLGAVDVFPIIPWRNITIEKCIELSREIGKKAAADLNLPVFLYNQSQKLKYRKELSQIRRGEFESLSKKLEDPRWRPDFGAVSDSRKVQMHPSAGALVIGARNLLVAFNINISCNSISIATDIASKIRKLRDSGDANLFGIKAIAWKLESENLMQISTNITAIECVNLGYFFSFCCEQAKKLGASILGSEIVGMAPKRVLIEAGRFFNPATHLNEEELLLLAIEKLGLSQLHKFVPREKIIEEKLLQP